MSNTIHIPVLDTFKYMGVVQEDYQITVRQLLTEFGISIREKKEDPFGNTTIQADERLGLSLEWAGNKANNLASIELGVEKFSQQPQRGHFDPTEQTMIDLKSCAGQKYEHNLETEKRRQASHMGGGFFSLTDTITFTRSLNTDDLNLLDGLSKMEAEVRKKRKPVNWYKRENPFKIEVTVKDGQLVSQILFPLKLELYRTETPRYSKFWINVPIRIQNLPPYSGFAAIDFGNSGCTFAIKEETNASVSSLEIVPVDKVNREKNDGSPLNPILKSAIYFKTLNPRKDPENPDWINPHPAAKWISGDAALEEPNASRLVVSPKRNFGKTPDTPLVVDDTSMSYHYPAQLLLTSVLQEAQYQKKHCFHVRFKGEGTRQPGLTLTYPATYSEREISHLRSSYIQAVTRAFQQTITAADVPIPDMVDEASAAAFYFLYRDFFFSDGRIPGFSYVYPNGANILVIDVGGGTTDVALVNCKAFIQAPTESARSQTEPKDGKKTNEYVLKMKVLGRTGLRHFGGDNMTIAVYKVLKTELARHLSGGTEFDCPKDMDFLDWYDGTDTQTGKTAEIDKEVPTQFKGREKDREECNNRRRMTKELWRWAERIKAWISKRDGRGLPSADDEEGQKELEAAFNITGGSRLEALLQKELGMMEGSLLGSEFSSNSGDWAQSTLPGLILELVPRIDGQFSRELDKLLKATNWMLRKRLPKDEHQFQEELHRVYIVGQAAYYPTLRERVAKELEIEVINHANRIIEPEWDADSDAWKAALTSWEVSGMTFEVNNTNKREMRKLLRILFDESELKHSVVKGAALLNFVNTAAFEAEFERDLDLSDLLPFDIVYESAASGLLPIYKEGDSYTSMTGRWETLTEFKIRVDQQRGGRFVTLLQRWPGDIDNKHPDQLFEFLIDQDVKGALKIQYRKAVSAKGYTGFVLKDTGNPDGAEIRGSYVEMLDLLPPMQRGDL